MSDLPRARIVRGIERKTGPQTRSERAATAGVIPLDPRALPRSLVWRLLFGGVIWFGWLCVAFGLLLAFLHVREIEPSSNAYDRQAIAAITSVETTLEENDLLYRVRYTFLDPSGTERAGESYTNERASAPGPWRVDYRSDDPSKSRLHGMHQFLKQRHTLFVVLCCVVPGLMSLILTLPRQLRRFWLLRHGVATSGKLSRKGKSDDVEGVPWLDLTFEYEVGGTTYVITVRTLRSRPIEADQREVIIYDPRAPARATTLDDLIGPKVHGAPVEAFPEACGYSIVPAKANVTDSGELEGRPGIAFNLLILPPALAAGLLVALVMRMI